ncbi:MAG: IS1 family transposase, partial [Tannerella sp.]|nr:IS1 family transposase [Tannerella sp.]
MNCPRCGSINYCKDGVIKGRQRYKCKDCVY